MFFREFCFALIIVKSDEEIIRKKTRRRGRGRGRPRGSGSWQGTGSGDTPSTVASTLATGAEATFEIVPTTDSASQILNNNADQVVGHAQRYFSKDVNRLNKDPLNSCVFISCGGPCQVSSSLYVRNSLDMLEII